MECVSAFLLMLVAVTVIIAVVGKKAHNRRMRRRLFQQLARQFAGARYMAGIFGPPRVRLPYGETVAEISEPAAEGTIRGRAWQIVIGWPYGHVRCEIVGGAGRRSRKHLRYSWPRVLIPQETLSADFLVTGFGEQDVQQLLTFGVCWHLDCLQRLGSDPRLYVLVHDSQIVVRKYFKRPSPEQATRFVQGALELYDQCMLARASGIEFLHSDEAQTLENVTCKVCGDALEDDLVYCRRCKTPHHLECWRYTGICSVFGCRETVYIIPQPGRPLRHDVNKPR